MKWQRLAVGLGCAAMTALAGCDVIDPDDIPRGGGGGGGEQPGCAAVLCIEGTTCIETKNGPQCVPADELPDPDPGLSCAAVLCIEGTTCIETEAGPQCVPTDELPDPDPGLSCAAVLCIEGTTCIETEAGPQCVPISGGEPCGNVTCAEGQVCCNASCGICTPPDGVCIQIACEPEPDPGLSCANVLCVVGTTCIETPAGPQCVPYPDDPCSLIDCPPDAPSCEVIDGEAVCVDNRPPASCAVTLCPEGTYCDDISGEAECIPLPSCEDVACEPGTRCKLLEVQCVRAPCPPQPSCVPVQEPCDEGRCGKGPRCGPNTCAAGQVCCNESCGICTSPGDFCTQQFCEATQ